MQSSPPENSTATRVLHSTSVDGGLGILRTRRLRESSSCCLSIVTEGEEAVNTEAEDGTALLNLPMLETCYSKPDKTIPPRPEKKGASSRAQYTHKICADIVNDPIVSL